MGFQPAVRCLGHAFCEDLNQPRLADAGLAHQEHDLAASLAGLLPAVEEQAHFLLAANQWRQALDVATSSRLRAALSSTISKNSQGRGHALQGLVAEVPNREEPLDEPMRGPVLTTTQ